MNIRYFLLVFFISGFSTNAFAGADAAIPDSALTAVLLESALSPTSIRVNALANRHMVGTKFELKSFHDYLNSYQVKNDKQSVLHTEIKDSN